MTIAKLFLYIALFATGLLIIAMLRGRTRNLLVNWVQFFVGGLFVFSGVVKAIDPIGTAIKMEEYFEVFIEYTPALEGFWHFLAGQALPVAVFMIVLEIFLGFTLLLGKYRRFTVYSLLVIILFFTFLTGFSHYTGKVTDCGCFGDFLKLTPFQSYQKDILLTALILILVLGRKRIASHFEAGRGNMAIGILTAATIWFTFHNILNLPVVDFRAYKEGTNIPECTTLPPDAKPYVYEITYIYRNKESGEEKEFVNSFPEDFSKWDYVDRKDKLVQKGDDPKCKDFIITDRDGNEVTDSLLNLDGHVILITSHDIRKASRKGFERMAELAAEAQASGKDIRVIGITGSSLEDAEALRHELGLAAPFYNLDAVPIKTMNRSNPGLVVLKEGTVILKRHHRNVRSLDKLELEAASEKALSANGRNAK